MLTCCIREGCAVFGGLRAPSEGVADPAAPRELGLDILVNTHRRYVTTSCYILPCRNKQYISLNTRPTVPIGAVRPHPEGPTPTPYPIPLWGIPTTTHANTPFRSAFRPVRSPPPTTALGGMLGPHHSGPPAPTPPTASADPRPRPPGPCDPVGGSPVPGPLPLPAPAPGGHGGSRPASPAPSDPGPAPAPPLPGSAPRRPPAPVRPRPRPAPRRPLRPL